MTLTHNMKWELGEVRYGGAYRLVIESGSARGFVCQVQAPIRNGDHDTEIRDARARLIVAAPDLLEACRAAFDEAAADNKNQALIDQLDAAITKAARI
jgi:hypothetical protein